MMLRPRDDDDKLCSSPNSKSRPRFEKNLEKTTAFFIDHNPVEIDNAQAKGQAALSGFVQLALAILSRRRGRCISAARCPSLRFACASASSAFRSSRRLRRATTDLSSSSRFSHSVKADKVYREIC
jgi:hypothetical protein